MKSKKKHEQMVKTPVWFDSGYCSCVCVGNGFFRIWNSSTFSVKRWNNLDDNHAWIIAFISRNNRFERIKKKEIGN